MRPIPAKLAEGPFVRRSALDLGLTPKMLRGKRFERIHYEVYRVATGPMTYDERLEAARLALPKEARLTGISRIQELGLDFGPRLPIHFVVEGDHHLDLDGVFLHRTKSFAPLVNGEMSVEGAFISYCSLARVIDAIKVGDWLLGNDHMDLKRLIEVAGAHLWRAGAHEALFITNFLTTESRSLKESETAACLTFAGLPRPEFNLTLDITEREVIGDLVYVALRLVIEYEGRQHQEDREEYNKDIDRYKLLRDSSYRYMQITDERLKRPQRMVLLIHEEMCEAGYQGPPPTFGENWNSLFVRVARLVGRTGPDRTTA